MSERDARKEPQPGDLLQKDGWKRSVRWVYPERKWRYIVFDEVSNVYGTNRGKKTTMTDWRSWARKAKVVK